MPKIVEISVADEAQKIGEKLILKQHPDLADARILYLFTNAKRSHGGAVVLGTAQRLSPLQRFLASGMVSAHEGEDFILLFSEEEWSLMDDNRKHALVNHELQHCAKVEKEDEESGDVTVKWGTRGHDLEFFIDDYALYGAYNEGLQVLEKAVLKRLHDGLIESDDDDDE